VDHTSILIVDTGPIWELVLYRAVNQLHFESLRRKLTYLVSPEAYQNCGNYVSSFRQRTTSASVVAELNNHIAKTEKKGYRQFWTIVRDEFERMGMDEQVVRLLDLDLELLIRFGPIDVSLLEMARRAVNRPVILTLDTKLDAECKRAQVGSEMLSQVCFGTR